MGSATIEDLPDPIIEYILSYLSPYKDLKQCMQVNKTWQRHVYGVVRKIQRDFNNAVTSMKVQWCHLQAEPGTTISKRYSHSACCCGGSMFIFGGCTTANTTFNDLWRLDLGTRCWIRPLATGTYPPPKACATLVCHEDNLVLFGGWTHTSPYPLHQVWRIFNHLHMYNTNTNRWTQVVTPGMTSPAMAGHSATIHGDLMVVFGGIQRQMRDGPSSRLSVFYSSNDVWILNLKTMIWKKQPTSAIQPLARYGHSQIVVDDTHILIMGGCGGPNMLFSDIWLLTMTPDRDEAWQWQEMEVRLRENSAPHLAFHPACKVGNQVIVMSKTQKSRTSPSSLPHILRAPSRLWIPPLVENERMPIKVALRQNPEVETCVNGKKGVLKRQYERYQSSSCQTSSSDEDDFQSRECNKKVAGSMDSPGFFEGPCSSSCHSGNVSQSSRGADSSSSSHGDEGASNMEHSADAPQDRNRVSCPPQPGDHSNSKPLNIRPNARRNRQRQLEGLDRMTQRLKYLRAGCPQFPLSVMPNNHSSSQHIGPSRNPMCMYVLDISTAIHDGYVTWRVIKNQCDTAPEEIILYSLVLGRGEMIMFGGIQKDLNSRQQEGESIPEVVSNSLHFMSAKHVII